MNGLDNILSLLGLALRGGRLAVGDEPAALAAEAGKARLILLAADAGERTLRRGDRLAEEGRCLLLTLPWSKAELGGALGRSSAAIAALTDTGLANALAQKLAALDPERYGETAQRMELKLRRAQERKTAPRRQPPPPERRRRRQPPGGGRTGPADGGGTGKNPSRRAVPPGGEGRREDRRGHSAPGGRQPAGGGKKPYRTDSVGRTERHFPPPGGGTKLGEKTRPGEKTGPGGPGERKFPGHGGKDRRPRPAAGGKKPVGGGKKPAGGGKKPVGNKKVRGPGGGR